MAVDVNEDANARTWQPRRFGVIGAGAMGTSLAAMAGTRAPVAIVCRNADRAAQLFRHGARSVGLIEASSRPIVVSRIADLAAIGGVSAIFVATKTTAIPGVAAELRPLLAGLADQPGLPFVVSYQNGIDPGRQLMELLGTPRVLRMVLNFGAVLDPETGASRVTLSAPPHAIGSVEPAYRVVCEKIASVLSAGGLRTSYEERIEREAWVKGITNAAVNPVAALVNSSIGQVMDSPARAIVEALLAEGMAVACAEGLDLGAEFKAWADRVLAMAAGHVPSMVEDIRAGRPSEIGQLNRQVMSHGRRLGIETPTHDIIDALIETFDWKVYARRGEAGEG